MFTVGTKELATDTDMAYEKYYLRVADLSKITDASGYYSLKSTQDKNYLTVMFVGYFKP